MKLYKYYPPESFDFVFTNSGISARLTPPRALNDPLEVMPSFSNIERDIINHNYLDLPDDHIEIKKKEINKTLYTGITEKYEKSTGILSLSKNKKSNPMWAYYAKDHTGYLIEFSSLKIGEDENTIYLIDGNIFRNVYYTNKRHQISKNGPDSNFTYTKDESWKHEKEVRLSELIYIENQTATDMNGFPIQTIIISPENISSIILGVRSSEALLRKISFWAEKYAPNVVIKRARLSDDSFDLIYSELGV